MSSNENVLVGVFLVALLLGGLLLLAKTNTEPLSGGQRPLHFIEDKPKIKGKHYKNLEQWHIKWSPDGDECWVDIKRDATQS